MLLPAQMLTPIPSARATRPFSGKPRYLSGYDLQKLTAGFSQCEDISVGSGTTQVVCAEYATRRRQFKKRRLDWRVSNPKSSKYSLGWIPFKIGHARYKAGQIQFAGQNFSLWDSYGLADHQLRSGSFNEDSRGRWYLNVAVEIPELVDPRLPGPTAGWTMFKTMLEYKCHQAGIVLEVVDEAYSTQTCSCCAAIPASSPKGRVGLGIREWACSECATIHDRDVNAARNILAAGHDHLAGGIP